MPIIRKGKHDSAVIKAWLDANGVRWPIPADEPIIIHGNYATAKCADIRWEHVHNTAHQKPGWRKASDLDLFSIYGAKERTWRIRVPISAFR